MWKREIWTVRTCLVFSATGNLILSWFRWFASGGYPYPHCWLLWDWTQEVFQDWPKMGSIFLKGVRLLQCSSSVIPVEIVQVDCGMHAREMLDSRNFLSQTPIFALQISSRGRLKLSGQKFWCVSLGLSFYFKTSTLWTPACHFSLLYSSARLIVLFGRGECSCKLQRGFLSIPTVPSQFSRGCGPDMEPRLQGGADRGV